MPRRLFHWRGPPESSEGSAGNDEGTAKPTAI